jgi:hypothetical protein
MIVVSPSIVARNEAVVLIPTAVHTSAHSLWPMGFPHPCARAIFALSAQLRLSTTTDPSKGVVPIALPLKKATCFAHGEKSDISSRTRGLAQPDV